LDTAIIVGVVIGSVVAIVLVFAKTVLGVAWTGKSVRKLRMILTTAQERLFHADDAADKAFLRQNETAHNCVQVEEN
jgi:hypothetical protein